MTITINDLNLREACVQAAREVISEKGVESWSMRDVARKLGISHQAPYRHFSNRDHLLAEIMCRCFKDFAEYLGANSNDSQEIELKKMGHAYMIYASTKPLEYRLMFGTPWPEPAVHSDVAKFAVLAFDILRKNLLRKHGTRLNGKKQAELEAMFIWSTLHGMASIENSNVMNYLKLDNGVQNDARAFAMEMIGHSLKINVSI